ncbi:MAG: hypothetical protein U0Y10_15240 [Spirosomataceae bacterium]
MDDKQRLSPLAELLAELLLKVDRLEDNQNLFNKRMDRLEAKLDNKVDKQAFENFANAVLDSYERTVSRKEFLEFKTVIEKRFDAVDTRFESIDQRFDTMKQDMDQRFDAMKQDMDQRFNSIQEQMVTKKDFIEYIGAIFNKIEEINKKL